MHTVEQQVDRVLANTKLRARHCLLSEGTVRKSCSEMSIIRIIQMWDTTVKT